MTTRINRKWILRRRPDGCAAKDALELVHDNVPPLMEGQVLVRNIYLSLDPTNIIWMSDREQYLPPVALGATMRGITLGIVEESRAGHVQPGTLLLPGAGAWEDFSVISGKHARPLPGGSNLPLTAWLSVLGATGQTAYFGMTDIGRPKAGETVVISAAAGAVGSIAGQIAKISGARVIGICGGPDKARWIIDKLGFDAAIDYRAEDVGAALDRLAPDGVDVNFENVGGAIMQAVFARMRNFGRVALCGLISTYEAPGPVPGPEDFGLILMRRLTVQGFVVVDYAKRAAEAQAALAGWANENRLQWKVHVVDGLEQAASAVDLLFNGGNDGKLLVQISPEP